MNGFNYIMYAKDKCIQIYIMNNNRAKRKEA